MKRAAARAFSPNRELRAIFTIPEVSVEYPARGIRDRLCQARRPSASWTFRAAVVTLLFPSPRATERGFPQFGIRFLAGEFSFGKL
jgi:hypothetical protein